jgi:excinuclease ABC subunit C
MVVAVDGKLIKSEYRTFNIRSTDIQDDYASMTETISRRLSHIGEENGSMCTCPDLILLDGGKGHVSVIKELMREKGFEIPVFGMVKDEHHKTRTLTDETCELNIARHPDVFKLIYEIQEEVHRYTVGRMTGAKRKTLKTSSLEKIHGIGPAKSKLLLNKFGSVTALKNASESDIADVPGISQTDAENVYNYFKKQTTKNDNGD